MPNKSDRAIVTPVTVADKLFEAGMEDELARVTPQWNLNAMVEKGWLSGDWSDAAAEAAPSDEPASRGFISGFTDTE